MTYRESFPIPEARSYKGAHDGLHTVIIGGMHGNERAGIIVASKINAYICSLGDAFAGRITIILHGNLLACIRHQRFYKTDLNRLFIPEVLDDIARRIAQKGNFLQEERRAHEIASVVQNADVVLDLHATTQPTPSGFIVCTKDQTHLRIAQHFADVEHIVLDPGTEGPLDQYVASLGKIGITYETGQLSDTTVVPTIVQNCKRLLSITGNFLVAHESRPRKNTAKALELIGTVTMQEPFSVPKAYSNFDLVPAGKPIAHSNGKDISTEKDTYIIFPNQDLQIGDIALELAQKVDVTSLPLQLYSNSDND